MLENNATQTINSLNSKEYNQEIYSWYDFEDVCE